MHDPNCGTLCVLLIIIAVVVIYRWRPGWRRSGTSHGSAGWSSYQELRRAGLFVGKGLILGRTLGGQLLTLPNFCHGLLIGGTGSGKGVSIIIPTLLSYFRGSLVCFDTKSDLISTTAERRRRMGHRIIDLAPFGGGKDKWNILDTVQPGPMLIDHARAIAEALVVRVGTEPDPHWLESAVMVICAALVFVLLKMERSDRNLNTVQEICADPALLDAMAEKLIAIGGIPARMGHHIKGLHEKERSGVMSTVARTLSFLNSELVAAAVATSTFDVVDLAKGGITLYLRIPPDQLLAQRSLLRCWMGTLVHVLGQVGSEKSPTLFLIDEASALGASLPALEEALVRGRSAGVRLLLAYQSESQVRVACGPDKPTLIHDNCDTIIYLCPPTGYETAEAISKRVGDHTIEVENFGENDSRSWQTAGQGESAQGNRGWSRNYSELARAVMKPEEIMVMSTELLIAFVRGMNPICARRVKWFSDPMFRAASSSMPLVWWLLLLMCLGLMAWSVSSFLWP